MRNALCCLMMSCAAIALHAADSAPAPKPAKKPSVSFANKPTATAQDKAVKISFALSAPGDVTVSIIDAQKKIVRHLAAGMLGGAVDPPEPLKKGLSQALLWDRTDDAGNKVAGGS